MPDAVGITSLYQFLAWCADVPAAFIISNTCILNMFRCRYCVLLSILLKLKVSDEGIIAIRPLSELAIMT